MMKKQYGRCIGVLAATPSRVSGAARLLDFGNTFKSYNQSRSPEEADARALANDWQVVGNDMRRAMRQFEEQNPEVRRRVQSQPPHEVAGRCVR